MRTSLRETLAVIKSARKSAFYNGYIYIKIGERVMEKIAGLIPAASKQAAFPTTEIGGITALKRIVLTMNKCGIWPILVVTGFYEIEVKAELMDQGVIFIQNDDDDYPSLFSSIKIGLDYLQDKCDAVLMAPVNIPMFKASTVKKLTEEPGDIINPSLNGNSGHPVLIRKKAIPEILEAEDREDGLRRVLREMGERRKFVNVEDEGILHTIHEPEMLEPLVEAHNRELLQPDLRIMIQKDTVFFDRRTRLLLEQLQIIHSVQGACKSMSLSKSKAWKMINELERQMGYEIVARRHGGAYGGKTLLTEKGEKLLKEYKKMEERIFNDVRVEFKRFLEAIDHQE